ncbi:MAG: hypothetical protein JKY65_21130 [Planctomycetes bacterium]|nr:hypothetical protein [Planctomycetota bacterium]
MSRKRNTAWAVLAGLLSAFVLTACDSSNSRLPPVTGGGGGQTTGGPTARSLPVPDRDLLGYAMLSVPLNAVVNGEVSGLGIAPNATDSLAAVTPTNDVLLVRQNVALQPAETTLSAAGRSVASVGSQVFVATGERGLTAAGGISLREETSPGVFTYSAALNSTADVAVVTTNVLAAVAAVDSSATLPPTLYRFDPAQRIFVASVALGAVSPTAVVSWPAGSADVYVGGTSGSGGRVQLIRVRGSAIEVLAIPSQNTAAGDREQVTGFAAGQDAQGAEVLLIAVTTFSSSGAPLDGRVLFYDGLAFVSVAAFSGDGPTAIAFTAENQLYIGMAQGRLLAFDPAQGFVAEPGFPTVSRVTSLLARDRGSLLVGCRTSAGALLVVRTRRSP